MAGPRRGYGSIYNDLVNAFAGAADEVAFFASSKNAFSPSFSTEEADAQHDTHYISADDLGPVPVILFSIPDNLVPANATNLSVRIGVAVKVLVAAGPMTCSFAVGSAYFNFTAFSPFAGSSASAFEEMLSSARTTDQSGATLTPATFKSQKWGFRMDNLANGARLAFNQVALVVTYTNPAVVAGDPLDGKEAGGTTARLNVLRLAAGRLQAVMDHDNLKDDNDGVYDWVRDTNPLTGPPGALGADLTVTGSLTGTVTSGGSPVPNAAVYLCPGGYHGQTDAFGDYAIPNVPSGSYTLQAGEPGTGYGTGAVVINAGLSTAFDVTLSAAYQDPFCAPVSANAGWTSQDPS